MARDSEPNAATTTCLHVGGALRNASKPRNFLVNAMNKLSLALTTATAIAAAAAAGSARAAEDSYVGAGIGLRSHTDLNCAAGADCDRNANGSGKIFFGKDLDATWGAEAFAYRLGKAKGTVGSPSGNVAGSVKAEGLGVAATARTQFDAFTFKARLGVAYQHGRTSYTAGGSDSKNALVPVAGLGVSYALNKQWSINGDWDHIRSKFSSQEKAGTNLFTVGASYRF